MLGHIIIQLVSLSSLCVIVFNKSDSATNIINKKGYKVNKHKSKRIIRLR